MQDTPPDKTGKTPKPRRLDPRRLLILLAYALILVYASATVYFLTIQRRMIYFPSPYENSYRTGLPPGTVELEANGENGERLVSFYVPPLDTESTTPPACIWVLFQGNAGRALDWLDDVEAWRDHNNAFLLVDYPGYGLSEGQPSRTSIIDASEKAWQALQNHLDTPANPSIQTQLATLGHSMGAAAALEFAVRHHPETVVLVSPYTSLKAMADRVVTPLLSWVLADRFDNVARLNELARLPHPPEIHLLHGEQDQIVPYAMGEQLSRLHPDIIRFHSYPQADHNWIIQIAAPDLARIIMQKDDSASE